MGVIAVCIEVAVIAIVGVVYFAIQDRKKDRKRRTAHREA